MQLCSWQSTSLLFSNFFFSTWQPWCGHVHVRLMVCPLLSGDFANVSVILRSANPLCKIISEDISSILIYEEWIAVADETLRYWFGISLSNCNYWILTDCGSKYKYLIIFLNSSWIMYMLMIIEINSCQWIRNSSKTVRALLLDCWETNFSWVW